ncbi:hypothetical protein ACO0SA_004513 [Hanseniaspora valbyensis]
MTENNIRHTSRSPFLKIKKLTSTNNIDKENSIVNSIDNELDNNNNNAETNTTKRPQFLKSFSASSVITSKSNKSSKTIDSSPLKKKREESPSNTQSALLNANAYNNNLQFESNKIFNKPLKECISLASAEVVLQSENVSFGKIPLIIAKCGSILKKHALSEPGIFRIAGNTKKIKLLQTIFSTPPKYGQDWKFEEDILPHGFRQFSVHDVSGILRRFLNNMSEPLIPLDCYTKFRSCLKENEILMRTLMNKNNNGGKIFFTKEEELQLKVDYLKLKKLSIEEFNANLQENKRLKDHLANQRTLIKQIRICLKKFEIYIREGLEDCNKQTLLYLLDLLFLFSQHSDKNLMDAKNLAAIFQPSILSHPEHDMNPKEYELSRIVLEFLINFSYKLLPNVFNIPKEKFQKQKQEDPNFIQPIAFKNSFSGSNLPETTTTGDGDKNISSHSRKLNMGNLGRRHSKSLSITMHERENMELLRVVNKSETEEEEEEEDDEEEEVDALNIKHGGNEEFDFEYSSERAANISVISDEDFGNNTTIDDREYESGNITAPLNDRLNILSLDSN